MTTTTKGSFDIPLHKHQSTSGARREYENFWGEGFPGDDSDIYFIANLVPEVILEADAAYGTTSRCEHMLWLMREIAGGS